MCVRLHASVSVYLSVYLSSYISCRHAHGWSLGMEGRPAIESTGTAQIRLRISDISKVLLYVSIAVVLLHDLCFLELVENLAKSLRFSSYYQLPVTLLFLFKLLSRYYVQNHQRQLFRIRFCASGSSVRIPASDIGSATSHPIEVKSKRGKVVNNWICIYYLCISLCLIGSSLYECIESLFICATTSLMSSCPSHTMSDVLLVSPFLCTETAPWWCQWNVQYQWKK
jgi:hypothetical protein